MMGFIPCIDANVYINADGSMDCPWLVPYYGDMSKEEYEAAGTALSVRRGCEYCYAMLEWRTRFKEEGWHDKTIANASHPDVPGERESVDQVISQEDKVVGYMVRWKLYNTMHDIEAAGWTLIYSSFSEGREIYEEEEEPVSYKDCGLPKGYYDQCCLNRSGMCTLDTADYREIDRALDMHNCGFIRVNDRYLMWKHGVSYKDLNCGHCQYYSGGTHGICINIEVEPHTKGVAVNGVKKYVQSREYWSGAHACKEFKKIEGEILAKKKVETVETVEQMACENLKGSSGPAMPEMFIQCQGNRIICKSKDEFYRQHDICVNRPEECGKASKVGSADNGTGTCETCQHGVDYGDSVEYIYCEESGKKKSVAKKHTCANYIPAQDAGGCDEPKGDLEELAEEKTIPVLTGTRFINGKRIQHCCNTDPHGGCCKNKSIWQEGGGTTSPDQTYIYCDLLHKKVYMNPAIPSQQDLHEHNVTFLIPEECPVIKNNPKEEDTQIYIYRGLA